MLAFAPKLQIALSPLLGLGSLHFAQEISAVGGLQSELGPWCEERGSLITTAAHFARMRKEARHTAHAFHLLMHRQMPSGTSDTYSTTVKDLMLLGWTAQDPLRIGR